MNANLTVDSPAARPPLENATQLALWLVAASIGLPDSALAGLGLDAKEVERLKAEHQDDLEAHRLLRATNQLMTRSMTAELLRCRVNCMALAARTPSELAAVARTVKTLPDWVWDDVVVSDQSAVSSNQRAGAVRSGPVTASGPLGAMQAAGLEGVFGPLTSETWTADGAHFATFGRHEQGEPTAPAPKELNRQQRRALEAKLRKGRG